MTRNFLLFNLYFPHGDKPISFTITSILKQKNNKKIKYKTFYGAFPVSHVVGKYGWLRKDIIFQWLKWLKNLVQKKIFKNVHNREKIKEIIKWGEMCCNSGGWKSASQRQRSVGNTYLEEAAYVQAASVQAETDLCFIKKAPRVDDFTNTEERTGLWPTLTVRVRSFFRHKL